MIFRNLASIPVTALLALLVSATSAIAQEYPTRSIRFFVGLAPGGGTDIVARTVASKLTEILGQQVIVENRTGAGGSIATDLVAKAAPDGYSLLLCNMATHAIGPAIHKKLPYHHIKDFAPVSLIATTPNVLVVHPALPVKNLRDFIALAKSNPGKINYGTSGIGTALHLTMELLKSMTGTNIVHIPYKGGSAAAVDLLSGQIESMFANLPTQLQNIRTGKVRALGISTAKRHPLVPDLPTIAEGGVPGFDVVVWHGMCAPSAVPKSIIAKLNDAVIKALGEPEIQKRLGGLGLDGATSSPDEFARLIRSETDKWAKTARVAGVLAE